MRLRLRIFQRVGIVAGLALASSIPLATLIDPGIAQAAGSISSVQVHPGPRATGYQNATYTITFTATNGIAPNNSLNAPGSPNGAAILITANNGTVFNGPVKSVTDNTNPAHSPSNGFCSYEPTSSSEAIQGTCNGGLNIPAGDSVTVVVGGVNNPNATGNYTLTVATNNDTNPVISGSYLLKPEGYWLVGSDGGVFTFGKANFYGSTGSLVLQRPVVGIVATADDGGYWLDASDGGVFSFGDTQFYGSIPGLGIHPAGSGLPHSLNAPIVGMVPSVDDHGYFMVAADGGVFAFGDARFAGSCPGIGGCVGAAVAVLPDATGQGYWLMTNLGALYAFGDAPYLGAPGNQGALITSAVRTPDGGGYWTLAADGSVHNYGNAADLGATSNAAPNNPATAIFNGSDNLGASVAYAKGGLINYGDAPFYGDMSNANLNGSIIAASGF